MSKSVTQLLDFEIDKLTDSIINRISGDSFETQVALLKKQELKDVTKTKGWNFNWRSELAQNDKEIYKLTIVSNTHIIQGLTSLTIKPDHVYLNLLENAPFNIGKDKLYEGVAGNLVAFACKLSFQRGGQGFVSFQAKTKLIDHYVKTLGAYHFGGHLMVIDSIAAQKLIDKYFKS